MQLPYNKDLPVNLLSACFNNTVATYKFYWFLSILQLVEYGYISIPKRELFARMISNAWFTVNFFHVSFGKSDKIQDTVIQLKGVENILIDDDQDIVFKKLVNTNRTETNKNLFHFNNQVPHWFLSPWFPRLNKNEIYSRSQSFENKCLYALLKDSIDINPIWLDYLINNVRVLKDFCYWNLTLFLQSKNPNVPDIANKLIKPAIRGSLVKQRKKFWDIVITELGGINCIYTGKKLKMNDYDIEHFIPYSFVSHDLIWNLLPAESSINRIKRDRLPRLEKYFDPFYDIQKTAVEIIKAKSPKNKFLEDYLTIFPNLNQAFTKERYKEQLSPLILIASNNGFEYF